jgi:MFS family permease
VTAPPQDPPVWRNPAFVRLWLAQAITQTAMNAIWYALLVIVEEASHSRTQLGITILSVIVPSVLFGVPAGAYVDRWDKRRVLVVTNAARCVVVLGYILVEVLVGDPMQPPAIEGQPPSVFRSTLPLLYAVSFVFSVITQFFAPAEAAVIPSIVGRKRLMQATSFFHLTFTASQLGGLVFVGPLLVKLLGPSWTTPFFMTMAALYLVSAGLVARLPREAEPPVKTGYVNPVAELIRQLREVAVLLSKDREMVSAMGYWTLGATLTLIVAMLAPGYVVQILGIAAADAVLVLAPAGLGMLIATLFLSRATTGFLADKRRIITHGLVLVSLSLGVTAALPALGRFLGWLRPEWQEIGFVDESQAALIGGVMLMALFAGFGFAAIMVAAQTLLQERAPERARGRVFAVQFTLANLASIIPLLAVGGLADVIGLTDVMLLLALIVMVVAWFSRQRGPTGAAPALRPGDDPGREGRQEDHRNDEPDPLRRLERHALDRVEREK